MPNWTRLRQREEAQGRLAQGCLDRLYKNALLIIIILFVSGVVFSLARAAIYKIRPYERGLHLRGGRFVGIDQPGWHVQIPFVDTVIGLNVIERSGTDRKAGRHDRRRCDHGRLAALHLPGGRPGALPAGSAGPGAIVAGFVQGTLRDVVNTRKMDEVMHSRAEINQEVIEALQAKEDQYGVEFVLVQIQSASPPVEVVNAIKDRMVAVQLQEQADAEAAQQRTWQTASSIPPRSKPTVKPTRSHAAGRSPGPGHRSSSWRSWRARAAGRAVHPGADRPGAERRTASGSSRTARSMPILDLSETAPVTEP